MPHLSMKRFGIAALLLVLLGSSLACGSRNSGAQPKPSATTPTPGTTAEGTAKRSKIVSVVNQMVVEGFTHEPSGSGIHDLEAAASLAENASQERAALERNGFVRAYVMLWRQKDVRIAVLAYEFRTPSGAVAFERYTVDDARRNHGATLFPVDAVKDATGQTQRDESDNLTLKAVTFTRDTVRYGVAIGASKTPSTSQVIGLARVLDALAS
jgi:hypothetical protein